MRTRYRVTIKPQELPREVHDRADAMLTMALAEAGYPNCGGEWDGRQYRFPVGYEPPRHVVERAQQIVMDALDIPYEERSASPGEGGRG